MLGRRWAALGHRVQLAARDPGGEQVRRLAVSEPVAAAPAEDWILLGRHRFKGVSEPQARYTLPE